MFTSRKQLLDQYRSLIETISQRQLEVKALERELKNIETRLLGETLPPQPIPTSVNGRSRRAPNGSIERRICELLSSGPATVKELCHASNMPSNSAWGCITKLKKQHLIRRLDDGRYELTIKRDEGIVVNRPSSKETHHVG